MSDLIVVGKVGAPYGIRGWLKIHSLADPFEKLLDYQPLQIKFKNTWKDLLINEIKEYKGGFVAQIENMIDRDKARIFTGCEIGIHPEQLEELNEGEYYWTDLVGLSVKTKENKNLGTVEDLLKTGANDVLVIKGEKEHLIPYVLDSVILSIDLEKKLITVDWDPEF